ncbi:MAG: hypothetical protein Q8Q33_09560, partial [Chlamydiota bacterium]|nr:hypothetical protein [Chlamydiota bacterium]
HYRTPIDFSVEAMKEAGQALERIESNLARALDVAGSMDDGSVDETVLEHYYQVLADDFNTPKAIGIVFHYLGQLNILLDKGTQIPIIKTSVNTLLKMMDVLGIVPDLERFVKVKETASCNEDQVKQVLERGNWTSEEVQWLVKAREGARKNRSWDLADQIRNKLIEAGIKIRDEKDGAKIIKK